MGTGCCRRWRSSTSKRLSLKFLQFLKTRWLMSYNDEIRMMLERKAGEPEHVNKLKVGFGMLPIEDRRASKLAGRPIFRDVEHIQVMVPGDTKSMILRPSNKKDQLDYPTEIGRASCRERG